LIDLQKESGVLSSATGHIDRSTLSLCRTCDEDPKDARCLQRSVYSDATVMSMLDRGAVIYRAQGEWMRG